MTPTPGGGADLLARSINSPLIPSAGEQFANQRVDRGDVKSQNKTGFPARDDLQGATMAPTRIHQEASTVVWLVVLGIVLAFLIWTA